MVKEKEWIRGDELIAGLHNEQNSDSQNARLAGKLKEEIRIEIQRDAHILILLQRYDVVTKYNGAEAINSVYHIYADRDGERFINLTTSDYTIFKEMKETILDRYL